VKIRAPLHSIDVRGRFAYGLVFSVWRGLAVGRVFTVPTNPRSARQLVIRGLITAASRAWAALTDNQRTGWDDYANGLSRTNVFGQDIKATGFNEYCALYMLASDVGESPVSDAPSTDAPILVTDGDAAEGAATGEIDVTWTAGQGGFVDIWITPVLGAGRKARESDYTHNSYTADATETKTISGLVDGGKYGVKFRQIFANGQAGPWTQETLNAKSS